MTATLTGDDLVAYNKALDFKNQGVKKFQAKDNAAALDLMGKSFDEIKKVQNPNQESKTLQANICQNTALIYKITEDFANSLKLSEKALEVDP